MSLNCKEINAILSELDLEGAFIQDVVQPGFDTIALYTYKSGNAQTLLICTANNACRINLTRKKIPKNEKPLRFMELLKSRIKGARIESIEQIGLERVVRINLNHQYEKFILYVRLWSNAANIILCNEANVIIDALYRRPKKNEMSGEFFLPPVPDKNKKND
ncbi:MAG: NFACT family protein, partial [Treponema sp.]|nr:NFACT family protein [Treponema sp.]